MQTWLLCAVLMCFGSGLRCFPLGRAGRRWLADPHSKRPGPASAAVSYALGFSSSSQPLCQGIHAHPRDATEGQPTNQRTSRTEGSAQTCRTGHRGLKSMTDELGGFRTLHE